MIATRVLLTIVLMTLPAAVHAEEAKQPEKKSAIVVRAVADELRRYGRDSRSMLRAPLRWDREQWSRAAIAAGTIAAAAAVDEDIADMAQRNRTDASEDFSRVMTPFGGRRALVLSGVMLAGGIATHNPKLRDTGRDAIEASILAAGIVTPILKRAVGRSRPFQERGAFDFQPFTENQSFPSGHSTNAFAVASVVAGHADGWVVPTIAYTLATSVAVSRVHDNVHFASDVLAGAAIGTAIGRAVVARHRAGGTARPVAIEVRPLRGGVAVQFAMSSAPLMRRFQRH